MLESEVMTHYMLKLQAMKVERMGRDKKKISVYPEVAEAEKSEKAPKAKSKKVNA